VANLLWPDRPEAMGEGEFDRHVRRLIALMPEAGAGRAAWQEKIGAVMAELAERAELLEAREERDRGLAVQEAQVDVSAAGKSRLQYEMAHERAFRAALRELRAVQARRRELEEAGAAEEDRPTGAEAPGDDPGTEPKPTVEAELPGEPEPGSDTTGRGGGEESEPGDASAPVDRDVASMAPCPGQPVPAADTGPGSEPKPAVELGSEPKPAVDSPRAAVQAGRDAEATPHEPGDWGAVLGEGASAGAEAAGLSGG